MSGNARLWSDRPGPTTATALVDSVTLASNMALWDELRAPGTVCQVCVIETNLRKEETMAEIQPFEIPRELRELAEKNVEQARVAYGDYGEFMDALAQAMAACQRCRRT
jgi:DnaJ-domain-containing protein 1